MGAIALNGMQSGYMQVPEDQSTALEFVFLLTSSSKYLQLRNWYFLQQRSYSEYILVKLFIFSGVHMVLLSWN